MVDIYEYDHKTPIDDAWVKEQLAHFEEQGTWKHNRLPDELFEFWRVVRYHLKD